MVVMVVLAAAAAASIEKRTQWKRHQSAVDTNQQKAAGFIGPLKRPQTNKDQNQCKQATNMASIG